MAKERTLPAHCPACGSTQRTPHETVPGAVTCSRCGQIYREEPGSGPISEQIIAETLLLSHYIDPQEQVETVFRPAAPATGAAASAEQPTEALPSQAAPAARPSLLTTEPSARVQRPPAPARPASGEVEDSLIVRYGKLASEQFAKQATMSRSIAPVAADRPSVLTFLRKIPEIGPNLRAINTQEIKATANAPLKYTVEKELAKGGMGQVLVVNDQDLQRQVAMKTLLPQLAETPEAIARFIGEAQATGQLEHPNIVPVHDIGISATGEVYFTMKLVRGQTLGDLLRGLREGSPEVHRQYSFTRRVQLFLAVCEAMSYAHSKGVLHRDLKPANIMIGPFGEVFVMDWGLAKLKGSPDYALADSQSGKLPTSREMGEGNTEVGSLLGTPSYMSPEQAQGQVDTMDQRSDVFALGAILYELLTLRQAFAGQNLQAILFKVMQYHPDRADHVRAKGQATVPIELGYICEKALQKDPDQRHQSVDELMADLQLYLEGTYPIVCPHTAVKRAVLGLSWVVDNYTRLVMISLVLLVMLPLVGLVLWLSGVI